MLLAIIRLDETHRSDRSLAPPSSCVAPHRIALSITSFQPVTASLRAVLFVTFIVPVPPENRALDPYFGQKEEEIPVTRNLFLRNMDLKIFGRVIRDSKTRYLPQPDPENVHYARVARFPTIEGDPPPTPGWWLAKTFLPVSTKCCQHVFRRERNVHTRRRRTLERHVRTLPSSSRTQRS